ncbi:MAG TPA: DUF2268 domain-containing putative Zn-dependent protease [Terriglobales bacterium]|nr:DUF2268 domain-containing putative Zn-dependent protease [Terriglobales bacterium]
MEARITEGGGLKRIGLAFVIAALAYPAMAKVAQSPASTPPDRTGSPAIQIEDVDRFYKLYDATGGHPTAEQLQRDYLDAGSSGLHHFAEARHTTAGRIADVIAQHPEIYSDARRCMAVLPQVRERLIIVLHKLRELYPEARFPPVTIAVGRGRPVAIGGPEDGIQVGLEALCSVKYFDDDVEDRFVHVIAHEYIHIQQDQHLANDEHPTVLARSLIEGAAEFVGEMISGGVGNPGVFASVVGHETEIETDFVPDEDKTDLSKWIDNGTPEKPGDWGYWVGYRIVKSYYQHAADKQQALREILQMNDPKALLAKSGWYPGVHSQ